MISNRAENIFLGSVIVTTVPDQVSANLDGETIILGMKSGQYYSLDNVGTRVWELMQAPISVNDLLNTILEEYDVDTKRCERDLHDLLQQLMDASLIEVQSEKGS